MLHLIPAPLHRAALRLAHALRKRWWRVRAPRIAGCRVIALDERGRVLLVRHSYGSGAWMPPGGGLGRREAPMVAALRELVEETGCLLDGAIEVTRVSEQLHGAGNRVHVIAGRTMSTPAIDRREIIEAAFFALDALPDPMPPSLRRDLPGWVAAFREMSMPSPLEERAAR